MGDARGEIWRAFFVVHFRRIRVRFFELSSCEAAGVGGTVRQGAFALPDQSLEAGSWHSFRHTSWHNEVCREMVHLVRR